MKLILEIGLFVLASILYALLAPIAFIYAIRPRRGWAKLTISYLRTLSVSKDQHGNVVSRFLFNDILIKDNTLRFGKADETISSVLGKNKRTGNLTKLGVWLDNILERLDKNHSINSIEEDE